MKSLTFLMLSAFAVVGCDYVAPVESEELEDMVEVPLEKMDYFPLVIGNKWTFVMTYARSESFSQDTQQNVTRINATGKFTWEVIAHSKSGTAEEFLLKEKFEGQETNVWFCRVAPPFCGVEEPFVKEVPRSWEDTLSVISERDSLWFTYLNYPSPERIPNVSYPFGTPYAMSGLISLPRHRTSEPDTLYFSKIQSLPIRGNVVENIGIIDFKVSCDFLASHRLNHCSYHAELVDYKISPSE